jgi:hypothetical protein
MNMVNLSLYQYAPQAGKMMHKMRLAICLFQFMNRLL